MYYPSPNIRTYNVTDDNDNIIRTVDHRYWTRGICRLNVRNFSDSDKTTISIDIDSDFNISLPIIHRLDKPRRFNIEPLTLSLSSQNFDDAHTAENYGEEIKHISLAMRKFDDILHTLDGLDNSNNITESVLGFGDLKKSLICFTESDKLTDTQKETIMRMFSPETEQDRELLKQRYNESQHVHTARPDETLDLLDKAYDKAIAYIVEHLDID